MGLILLLVVAAALIGMLVLAFMSGSDEGSVDSPAGRTTGGLERDRALPASAEPGAPAAPAIPAADEPSAPAPQDRESRPREEPDETAIAGGARAPDAQGKLRRAAAVKPAAAKKRDSMLPASASARDLPGSGRPKDSTLPVAAQPAGAAAPEVTMTEEPEPSQPIAPDRIREVLSAHEQDVSSCHQNELKAGETAPPEKVDLTITVKPSGEVESVTVHPEELRGTSLAQCITLKVKSWSFPSFKGTKPQEISVPIVLIPGRS